MLILSLKFVLCLSLFDSQLEMSLVLEPALLRYGDAWERASSKLSYEYLVCSMAVTDDITPKTTVRIKITIAIQNVYHCKGLRRSAQICVQPTGGEWKTWCNSRSLPLQWSNSAKLVGETSSFMPSSRWKFWPCWSMKLSVWESQRGNRNESDSSVSFNTEIGIGVLGYR